MTRLPTFTSATFISVTALVLGGLLTAAFTGGVSPTDDAPISSAHLAAEGAAAEDARRSILVLVPADGAVDVNTTPTLIWDVDIAAQDYELTVFLGASSTPVHTAIVPQSLSNIIIHHSVTTALLPETLYTWQFCARSASGSCMSTSALFSFTTAAASGPPPPVLTAPGLGETYAPMPVLLDWQAAPGAVIYHLQVDDDPAFGSPAVDEMVMTTSHETSSLAEAGLYFWRVRSVGGVSWSPTWFFTAGSWLTLYTPADGATGVSVLPTFDWQGAADLDGNGYNLTVYLGDANVDPSTVVHVAWGLPMWMSYHTITNPNLVSDSTLLPGTLYSWRVCISFGGCISTSRIYRFTTEGDAPSAPSTPLLAAPANGATEMPLSVTLDWDPATDADTYDLQLDDDFAFGSPEIDETELTGTSHLADSLAEGTAYYWRVRSVNAVGTSAWSPAWAFVTDAPLPTLVAPDDDVIDVSIAPTLRWVPRGEPLRAGEDVGLP